MELECDICTICVDLAVLEETIKCVSIRRKFIYIFFTSRVSAIRSREPP